MPKTKSESETGTRSHEHELRIDAPADVVWRAITEATELVNWFPLEAEAAQGRGGSITYRWAEDMTGVSRILKWDPPRHLRTSWMEPVTPGSGSAADDPEQRQIAVDWHVEGREGATVLRLVHSGFGRDARWDTEFDGTRRGWDFELLSLKHYLERHRGRKRSAFWLRVPIRLEPAEVWEGLTAAGRLLREGLPATVREGGRYRIALETGEVLEGSVLIHTPPTDFAGTVESQRDGLFRLGYEICAGQPEAVLWLSAWDADRTAFERTRESFRTALTRAFER